MAHKKAGGSTALGRESQSQRLGIKLYAGEPARPGSIIVRQRGTHYRAGTNVKRASDDTLFSIARGVVKFSKRQVRKFTGKLEGATFVHVVPSSTK